MHRNLALAPVAYAQEESITRRGISLALVKSIRVEDTFFSRQGEKLVESKWYIRSNFIFDRQGKIREKIQYNPDGSFGIRAIYTYTSFGRPAEVRYYGPKRRLLSVEVYNHDTIKNTAEVIDYDEGFIDEDSIQVKSLLTYDRRGNVVTVGAGIRDGTPYIEAKYTYDADGNEVELTRYRETGEPFMRKVQTYDGNGNITEVSFYDGIGGFIGSYKYTYEFDATGNWIKRVRWAGSDFEPSGITYRIITYY